MYQSRKLSQEKQRRSAAFRLSSALMEAVDEAQYAAAPEKPFVLTDCLQFLLSRTGKILLCGFVFFVLMLAFYQIAPPKYKATSKLYILENDGTGVQMSSLQAGSLLVSDYREVLKNWEVHEAVRSQLGLDLTYSEMQEMLTVQIPSGSRLLYITVSHTDPVLAADLANAYASAAHTFIVEKLHGMRPDMFSSAIIPSHVSGLGMLLRLLLAFAVGAALMTGFYTVFFCLDHRVRNPEDLALASDTSVLGVFSRREGTEILPSEKEQACLLASRLLTRDAHCVLLSAPHGGEGVSFVCSDLVQALNELHCRSLWIRVEHNPFSPPRGQFELADFLEERCSWKELLQTHQDESLLIIHGTEADLPTRLFHPRMAVLMENLRSFYDIILVDVPPIDRHVDGSAFFRCCDGCIVVASSGKSALEEVASYTRLLAENGLPVLGSVLNNVPVKPQSVRFSMSTAKASVDA